MSVQTLDLSELCLCSVLQLLCTQLHTPTHASFHLGRSSKVNFLGTVVALLSPYWLAIFTAVVLVDLPNIQLPNVPVCE